eukprot:CAMPEP_0194333622 /NCGR_PEP_ID=MMETSP0171-20130528/63319_1 /TAXON_ID=218684 /ORGANISM="Corethron pennatum, Strain L29A3" /LENGTH=524 /DNA_ID=CAMNT_0039095923 /DNA_START=216 /DNA_END=1789 /DNA_ORIENTATION=-
MDPTVEEQTVEKSEQAAAVKVAEHRIEEEEHGRARLVEHPASSAATIPATGAPGVVTEAAGAEEAVHARTRAADENPHGPLARREGDRTEPASDRSEDDRKKPASGPGRNGTRPDGIASPLDDTVPAGAPVPSISVEAGREEHTDVAAPAPTVHDPATTAPRYIADAACADMMALDIDDTVPGGAHVPSTSFQTDVEEQTDLEEPTDVEEPTPAVHFHDPPATVTRYIVDAAVSEWQENERRHEGDRRRPASGLGRNEKRPDGAIHFYGDFFHVATDDPEQATTPVPSHPLHTDLEARDPDAIYIENVKVVEAYRRSKRSKWEVAITLLVWVIAGACIVAFLLSTPPPVVTAPTFDLRFVKDNPEGLLGRCEGDCDRDTDCTMGLRCFRRDGEGNVPGCRGGPGDATVDYCVRPQDVGGHPTTEPTRARTYEPTFAPTSPPTKSAPPSLAARKRPSDAHTNERDTDASPDGGAAACANVRAHVTSHTESVGAIRGAPQHSSDTHAHARTYSAAHNGGADAGANT